jgi:hypothetical protein
MMIDKFPEFPFQVTDEVAVGAVNLHLDALMRLTRGLDGDNRLAAILAGGLQFAASLELRLAKIEPSKAVATAMDEAIDSVEVAKELADALEVLGAAEGWNVTPETRPKVASLLTKMGRRIGLELVKRFVN